MAETLVCVKADTRKVEMQRMPFTSPGPGQALLKMRLSTICGSDVHILDEMPLPAGTPMGQTTLEKLADTPQAYDLFRSRKDGVIKIAIRP